MTKYMAIYGRGLLVIYIMLSMLTHGHFVATDKPNFIIFYIDDLRLTTSWSASRASGDMNGHTLRYYDVPTPNINAIMNQGIVFPRSYASAPACSPSRYSLLTGRLAVRSAYAISQTLASSNGYSGARISVKNARLSEDIQDSTHNIPAILQDSGYYTGMTGKWHLMTADDNGKNYECSQMDVSSDEILYDICKDLVKMQGFDFVDAYYHDNIAPHVNTDFSHNPEWMVSVSQKFIGESVLENKPFFLYFSSTLAHDPNIYAEDVLFSSTNRQTPQGILSGDDIPSDTGMATRAEIWQMTLDTLGVSQQNIAQFDNDVIHNVAAAIWIDNAIGAMIDYLKANNLYENTFIVVANDHGYDAKGTLYEYGSRIFQYIRYPPLFGTNGYVMPDDFIVANYDLAAVIFALSESTIPSDYVMDGTNWLTDVVNEIHNTGVEMTCCKERYMDVYNSHAIVNKNNKYIFRATDEIWNEYPPCYPYHTPYDIYPFVNDTEQIYRLTADPSEQVNKIDSAGLSDTVFEFRAKMINYIENVACIGVNSVRCVTPVIDNQDIPGYTCNDEVTYGQIWQGVIRNDYDASEKLNEAKTAILAVTSTQQKWQRCNLEGDFSNHEYVYMFDKPTRKKLRLNLIVCCRGGESFGSKYKIWPMGYQGNSVYNNNGFKYKYEMNNYKNERIENVVNSMNSNINPTANITIQSMNNLYIFSIIFIIFMALLLYYCIYQRNDNKFKRLMDNDNQCGNHTIYGSTEQNI